MLLKDRVRVNVQRVTGEWVPAVRDSVRQRVRELAERLDELNCSLAARAMPANRRNRVMELDLRMKAVRAGQGSVAPVPLDAARRARQS